MTLGYINLSKQAVAAEKRGDFAEAAKLWEDANRVAQGKNVYWSDERADFCRQSDKRTKILAGEAFPHERTL